MPELTFNCEEPGCTEKVLYNRDDVSGALLKTPKWLKMERSVAVYLTCPAGHVHRYKITLNRPEADRSE